MQTEHFKSSLDRLGMGFSIVCAVHCMAMPIVVLVAPWAESAIGHGVFHWLMFGLVAPVAFFTLFRYRKVHNDRRPLYLGSAGLVLLLVGVVWGEMSHHSHSGEIAERTFTTLGSVLLFLGHWFNLKKAKHCGVCHSHH